MESSIRFEAYHQVPMRVEKESAAGRAAVTDAFERAVLPHLDEARTVARCLLRDECDAQDAVQDAMMRALRYYDTSVTDARAWLLTIVRRCCFDWKSRWKLERPAAGAPQILDVHDPSPGPEENAAAALLRDAIAAAIEALPAYQREIVLLREVHDLPYHEISRIAELPVGTVMSRLSRARRRLQRELESLVGVDEPVAG